MALSKQLPSWAHLPNATERPPRTFPASILRNPKPSLPETLTTIANSSLSKKEKFAKPSAGSRRGQHRDN
ncbi:hypothetical protein KM043_012704 [Ampulex compressa]|nr:hypothetical protein KM043_012704 [Ampulex compressa]